LDQAAVIEQTLVDCHISHNWVAAGSIVRGAGTQEGEDYFKVLLALSI